MAPINNKGTLIEKFGTPTTIPVETASQPKRAHIIAYMETFGSSTQPALTNVVHRELTMKEGRNSPSLVEYGGEEKPPGGLIN